VFPHEKFGKKRSQEVVQRSMEKITENFKNDQGRTSNHLYTLNILQFDCISTQEEYKQG
jgi:hypothetical protein